MGEKNVLAGQSSALMHELIHRVSCQECSSRSVKSSKM